MVGYPENVFQPLKIVKQYNYHKKSPKWLIFCIHCDNTIVCNFLENIGTYVYNQQHRLLFYIAKSK